MNNKYLILAIFNLFLCLSCKNDIKEKTKSEVNFIKLSKDSLIKKDVDKLGKSKHVFIFSNDTIKQELFIYNNSIKERIEFKLIYNNYLTKEKFNLEGIAEIIKETIGQETISDYEGNGYFVDEYKYHHNGSDIIFRIDNEEFEVANVFERNSKLNKYGFLKPDNIMFNKSPR